MSVLAFVVTPSMVAAWVLIPIVMTAFFYAMVAAARQPGTPAEPASAELVFRYSLPFRAGAVGFAIVMLSFITGLIVTNPPKNTENVVSVILLYVLFGSLCGALLWDVFRFRLTVGPDGLDCRSPWRRRVICWADVEDVTFNGPLGWFEIRASNGRSVRLPASASNLDAFLAVCEERLTPGQLEPARMAYIFLGREFPTADSSTTDDTPQ